MCFVLVHSKGEYDTHQPCYNYIFGRQQISFIYGLNHKYRQRNARSMFPIGMYWNCVMIGSCLTRQFISRTLDGACLGCGRHAAALFGVLSDVAVCFKAPIMPRLKRPQILVWLQINGV